ncbi:hypothetical protein QVD17_39801 [Tagetes erecta]|uniref:Uncharacterized protein n=1 Tax=Tagetes erecta TaxID=13708 RepID=A0AAD8NHG2_TARER|nr:hypothetical protein QVD17_39801 [Tagetes erecta]
MGFWPRDVCKLMEPVNEEEEEQVRKAAKKAQAKEYGFEQDSDDDDDDDAAQQPGMGGNEATTAAWAAAVARIQAFSLHYEDEWRLMSSHEMPSGRVSLKNFDLTRHIPVSISCSLQHANACSLLESKLSSSDFESFKLVVLVSISLFELEPSESKSASKPHPKTQLCIPHFQPIQLKFQNSNSVSLSEFETICALIQDNL